LGAHAFVAPPSAAVSSARGQAAAADASIEAAMSAAVGAGLQPRMIGGTGAATAVAAALATCLGTTVARRRAAAHGIAASHGRPRAVNVAVAAEEGEAGAEWSGAEKFSALTNAVPLKLDNVAIAKILPHRYPFLLVDKVVEFEAGKRAVGVKNVTANEPQFTGHFPDRPIMPGVLMVEAMAQLGGIVALQEPVSDGKGEFFFAGIDGIKFRRPVVPGDTLVMEMELKKWRPKYGIAKMTGKAYVDGQLALEVKEFTFALVRES